MPDFVRTSLKLEASRRRIVSIWFGNVDHIAIQSDPNFSGVAVLTTLFTLSGHYQYNLLFMSMSHRFIETWRIDPAKIPISDAAMFEKQIFEMLQDHAIDLSRLPPDSPQYHRILSMLPMAFDDENQTSPAGIFDVSNLQPMGGASALTPEEIQTLRSVLRLF